MAGRTDDGLGGVIRWSVGVCVGTLLVGVFSPLFVRSYNPRVLDPVRGVAVYRPGETIRWRSEGYARSSVGPMGMVGQLSIDKTARSCVVLWGDSQAEGVCVADDEKLHVQLRCVGLGQVLPMARSGDRASDWIAQMPAVERFLRRGGCRSVRHVWLVCESSDLTPMDGQTAGATPPANSLYRLPAFVIHAARRVMEDPRTGDRRGLRLGVGPVGNGTDGTDGTNLVGGSHASPGSHWSHHAVPNLILLDARPPGDDMPLDRFLDAPVIDCRPALAAVGPFPARGFHNGTPGAGHLNAAGYRAIAAAAAAGWPR